MRNPDRILLVRLSHLGDVVHSVGLFHALHAAYPAAEIGWAIQPEFAPLIAGLKPAPRLFQFERHGGIGAWWRLRRELAAFRADWTLDAQANSKSAAASWLSRARRRVAPARADWQEPWAAWTATERAPALRAPLRHAMDRTEELARHVLGDAALPLRRDVGLNDEERERGERELERFFPALGLAPVLVHLSTPGDVRSWPPENWRGLMTALERERRDVLVLSGPSEAALGRRLEQEFAGRAHVRHWVDQRGLRELAALFSAAARRGGRLVACDSGPMHLAAAQGLAVVALEGPEDAARTGPWPRDAHSVVRSPEPPPCAPCRKARCRHADGPVCMSRIDAEHVLHALAGRS